MEVKNKYIQKLAHQAGDFINWNKPIPTLKKIIASYFRTFLALSGIFWKPVFAMENYFFLLFPILILVGWDFYKYKKLSPLWISFYFQILFPALFILSLAIKSGHFVIFTPKYSLFFLPFFLLVLGKSIKHLGEVNRSLTLYFCIFYLFVVAISLSLRITDLGWNRNLDNQNFALKEKILQLARKNSPLLIETKYPLVVQMLGAYLKNDIQFFKNSKFKINYSFPPQKVFLKLEQGQSLTLFYPLEKF